MTIVVPFKEGTVPGLQPQGGFFRKQRDSVPFESGLESTANGNLPGLQACTEAAEGRMGW